MRQTSKGMIAAGCAALLLLAGCGGGGGDDTTPPPPPANVTPTANAGAPQTVNAGAVVTLNGSASSDPDGTIATYAWTQSSGTAVTLSSTSTAQPTFTAPTAAATLVFSLTVTDNRGASAASTVTITVNAAPVANAGPAQTVTAGATVTLDGSGSADADGSIASYAWTQTLGPAVTLSSNTAAQPTFTAPGATTTLVFSLVVTDNRSLASSASTVTITVNALSGNGTVSGVVRFERIPFLNVSPFGLNYANPVLQPARGVIVRAVDAATSAVLATGATTNTGSYSLSVAANTNIRIQVVARMQRDTTQPLPRWDVRVQDGTGSAATRPTYSYTGTTINSNIVTHNVDIPSGISAAGTATGAERPSGPFAILDTIYVAMQTVLSADPVANFPELYVDWGTQTAGTFFTTANGHHIALMADLTEDTDEFDRHVVAHEFGHYLERNFSRSDSIGGSHGLGDRLDPRVAFGEGWGYAFAAIALNDSLLRDSFVNNGTHVGGGYQIEINPAMAPPLSPGDAPACWCSESSVWSLLWDLYDTPADANDNVALGFAPLWSVLVGAQRTTPAVTSIFSFIDALKAARPGDAAAINVLVSAQNINAAAIDAFGSSETNDPKDENNVVIPGMLPVIAPITLGTPVVLRTIDDHGVHNRIGNRRLLRFTPLASGPVTVTLASSNVSSDVDPDFVVWRAGTAVAVATASSPNPQTATFNVTANTTYIIDAYDCANGCDDDPMPQGTRGDYDLTVTIN